MYRIISKLLVESSIHRYQSYKVHWCQILRNLSNFDRSSKVQVVINGVHNNFQIGIHDSHIRPLNVKMKCKGLRDSNQPHSECRPSQVLANFNQCAWRILKIQIFLTVAANSTHEHWTIGSKKNKSIYLCTAPQLLHILQAPPSFKN